MVTETSFLKELFDVIQQLPVGDRRRERLTVARDALAVSLLAFRTLPSTENMILLNGAWAVAAHIYDTCKPAPPTAPKAGSGSLDRKVA